MTPSAAPAPRPMLTSRPNASRKLLVRKAIEKLAPKLSVENIEESFPTLPGMAAASEHPTATGATIDGASIILSVPSAAPASAVAAKATANTPQSPPAWSDEDERAFRAHSSRRKAAGYRTRGNDVEAQLLTVGFIKPNPNTTVAVIVGLIGERGSIARAELLDAMASVTFSHPKAQPADAGWCQGYVAGAIRNGFLRVDDGGPAKAGEA